MSKSELITLLFVLAGFACIATAPFNLFPYHAEIAAIEGLVCFMATIMTLASELKGYRIKITRKEA